MFKSYFLITFRNLWKNKAISIVKIAGLAIGLSAVFLIYLYVSFEYSYDNYHKNGDRIYRVAYHVNRTNAGAWNIAKTGDNLAGMLRNSFPEIESTSRVSWMGGVSILQKNQKYLESKWMFADPSVLTMFSFPMKYGDRNTALNDSKSIVISSRIAKKYFGDENPIGKILDDKMQFKVTGVIDVPDNSHFRFDILASYDAIYSLYPILKKRKNETIDQNIYTYLMLKPNANVLSFKNKLTLFASTYIKKGQYDSVNLFLEPIKKIHLESDADAYYGEMELTKFNTPLIYLFEILGFIILGIACFNFINIAVAQIVGRTKEVGVRKVYGSKKSEIFAQFVYEYGLSSFLAVLMSMLIVVVSLPYVNSILNRQIQVNYMEYFAVAISVMFLVTILTGFYPSFVIAKFRPIMALRNGFSGSRRNLLKSTLVVSQLTVSVFLILTSVYIAKQINNLTEMDMGINTKDVLVVNLEYPKSRKNYELLKSELLRNPDIISVSASSNIPAVSGANMLNIQIEGKESIPFPYISIDPGFTNNLGVKTIEGRNFYQDKQTASKSTFLLNKAAVKILSLKDPVGKGIVLSSLSDGQLVTLSSGQIVGVIDDYSYRPNYDESKGVVFNYDPDRFNAMLIHIRPDNQKATTMMVKNVWKKLCPDIPFVADFLVNEIKNDVFILKLHSLQSFISPIAVFSFLIALLGLFGLSIISAKQRVKEISIRRVNGALITDLLILMNRRFIYLVIISIAISFPLIFFITEEIRKDSEKATSLSWVNYVITAIVILTLALLTVSWQSWKAATKNPMDAFINE